MIRNRFHVYFASCTKAGGIFHYIMEESGTLEFVSKTFCDRPMYMILEKKQMYVLLRQPFPGKNESGLIRYDIGANGELQQSSEIVSTRGVCACHLFRLHGQCYVTNYLSGSIWSESGDLVIHQGRSVRDDRQDRAHPHCIVASPDEKYLMVADLGLDYLFLYDERLKRMGRTAACLGQGPRHLACLDSEHVLCVNELECSISVYQYWNKKLKLLVTVPILDKITSNDLSAAIRVNGEKVYVSTRGADLITVFSWCGHELKKQKVINCGGESPRDIWLVNGKLFCMNEKSSTVTVFSLDEKGLPFEQAEREFTIENVLCGCSLSEEIIDRK